MNHTDNMDSVLSFKELLGTAALGVSYLNAKHRISDDLYIIPHFLTKVLQHLVNCYRGRVDYWHYFEGSVKKYHNRPAVVYPRRIPGKTGDEAFEIETYTYEEFYDIVLRLSHILVFEYGVTNKDTIAMDMTNKPLFLFFWFALWNIGATPSFLNYNISHDPLVHSIKIVEAKQVFVDPDLSGPIIETMDDIRRQLPDLKVNFLDERDLLNVLSNPRSPKYRTPDELRKPNAHDWDTLLLIYTSGTTGLPKSGILSWRKLFLASTVFSHIERMSYKSTVFTAMPLYHSTLAMLGILPIFTVGGTAAISHTFSLSTFWTQLKLCGATHMQYVGEVCRYLLNTPPHPDEKKHKIVCAYGNGLRRDIWVEFKQRFNIPVIGEFYGSTEAPLALTTYQKGEFGIGACRNYGTIINTILSLQQCIVKMDPEDDSVIWRNPKTGYAQVAKPGESGELLMRIFNPRKPETSFQGYLNNEKETKSKVVRDVFRKGDAYFRTGDLIKADNDGLWYFVDRLGDTFRWKSENVSTTEVENQLTKLDKIYQCCVVGIKIPRHEGRGGFAVIEPRSFENFKPEVLLDQLASHVMENLPSYARPLFVRFAKIITNSTHKVPKKQYKNTKLPRGENNDETIYWLNPETKKYEELDELKWLAITEGKAKL